EAILMAEGSLPMEVVATSVHVSGGYVKLAFYVAQMLVKQHVPLVELRQTYDIQRFLKKFVPRDIALSLQALSLLSRLGWEDEVRQEAQAVASAIGLQFQDLQRAVRELREQGIVLSRGRYLYVS